MTQTPPRGYFQNYQARQNQEFWDKQQADDAAKLSYDTEHALDRVGDLPPGWGDFFDREAINQRSLQMRGRNSVTNYGGIGNGVSVRQGGQTVATSSPGMRSLFAQQSQQQAPPAMDEGQAYWDRREAALDRANARSSAALDALEHDPDRELATGRAGVRARQQGDISRGEFKRNAVAEAEGQQDAYNSQDQMRRDQHFDKVNRLRELAPYDPALINANAKLDVAGIGADARVQSANASAAGRVGSAAINSLGRTATALTMPGQQPQVDAAISAIQPNVPGQAGAVQGGGKPFPAQRLPAFMQQFGFQSEQQAKQYLQSQGYAVQ